MEHTAAMSILLKNIRNAFPFIFALLTSCAKVGEIGGGDIDKTPPQLVKSIPEDNSVSFKGNEIILEFDEYIKLIQPNQKLFLNPKPKDDLTITSKKNIVSIYTKEFKSNTTYTLQNRGAIVDFSASNPFTDFTIMFSTGDSVDYRGIVGTISDQFDSPLNGFTVFALPALSELIQFDSSINQTYTNKEGRFQLRGLKVGCYKLIALEDQNNNLKYESFKERVAFADTLICLNQNDTTVSNNLIGYLNDERLLNMLSFKKRIDHYEMVFNKPFKALKTDPQTFIERIDSKKVKLFISDTLNQTLKISCLDSFNYTFDTIINMESVGYLSKVTGDSSIFKNIVSNISDDVINISLKLDYPYTSSISLAPTFIVNRKDTVLITHRIKDPFSTNLDLYLSKAIDADTMHILILGKSISDIYKTYYSDTSFTINLKPTQDFSSLSISLDSSQKCLKAALQFKNKIIYPVKNSNNLYYFEELNPGEYLPLLYHDRNKDQMISPGDLSKRLQPETVYIDSKSLKLKAGWTVENYKLSLNSEFKACE